MYICKTLFHVWNRLITITIIIYVLENKIKSKPAGMLRILLSYKKSLRADSIETCFNKSHEILLLFLV